MSCEHIATKLYSWIAHLIKRCRSFRTETLIKNINNQQHQLFRSAYSGSPDYSDFFSQHFKHKKLFSNVIMSMVSININNIKDYTYVQNLIFPVIFLFIDGAEFFVELWIIWMSIAIFSVRLYSHNIPFYCVDHIFIECGLNDAFSSTNS